MTTILFNPDVTDLGATTTTSATGRAGRRQLSTSRPTRATSRNPRKPIQLEPHVRVVPEVGGVMLLSGNQLHSTVPNTSGRTRFSIDFRTVNIDDVVSRREAPNVDSECTGTSLRDFLRASDFDRICEDAALAYEGVTAGG